jgi:molybdopterin-guanine dinucleotide biosynthesis protein A
MGGGALRTAIVLAGGKSSRIGVDKGLVILNNKPLVAYVVERLEPVVDEVILVVGSQAQVVAYAGFGSRVIRDKIQGGTPLVGAYTGFMEASAEYAFLTAVDQPLLDPRIVELLFKEAGGHDAATPTWANGWVEPLHAVYKTKPSASVGKRLIEAGDKKLSMILSTLRDVVHIPINEVKALDPELRTFMDIDTSEDLEKISCLLAKNR